MHQEKLDLARGVGLRREHFTHLLEHDPGDVAWFEIISENFFEPGGRPWAVLEKLRAERPVVMHGVAMGVGNATGISRDYLARLAALIERVEPAWISDHLCWGGFGGHYAHDLLPLPYTEEAVRHVAAQVRLAQDVLGRRMLLENVSSYVGFEISAMSEVEFVCAVAAEADCGLLLDINNVYVSAHNHGFDAGAYVDAIPAARIGQIHLAGHSDQGDYLFDSHDGPVIDAVWALYRRVIERVGAVPTLIEWDEHIPSYERLAGEARAAGELSRSACEARDAAA
ncbi:MAG: DUF692 domain-containing protein [Myxococcales bacterium]|nr:DUF692 domain-containing protein [Myxococcales bacterium]